MLKALYVFVSLDEVQWLSYMLPWRFVRWIPLFCGFTLPFLVFGICSLLIPSGYCCYWECYSTGTLACIRVPCEIIFIALLID